MTKAQIIDKYIQRIMVDYPEADKIHIDLVQFAEEFNQCNINGSLPPALDLQQEAEEAWERENREFSNRSGINPHAYVLGYKAGAKRECALKGKPI